MKKFSKNAIMLMLTLLLNNITSTFIYTFLLAYILDVSNDSIVNVALFYLVLHSSMIVLSWICAPLFKKVNKALSLVIGVVFKFVFILITVLMGSNIINYVYLIALLDGISEVLFWGGANALYATVTNRYVLPLYMSVIKIAGGIMNFVIPVTMGLLIDKSGMYIISVITAVVVTIQLVLSLFIKVPTEKDNSKLQYTQFWNSAKQLYPQTKNIYLNQIFLGIVSNVSMVMLYYTVLTFGSNLSLGIFTTISSILAMLVLVLYNVKRNIGSSITFAAICDIMVSIGIIAVLITLNKTTLILFYLFYNITCTIPDTLAGSMRFNITKNKNLEKYNIENVTISECFLDFGRVIGEALLLAMGLINTRTFDTIVICFIGLSMCIYYVHTAALYKHETKLFTKSRTEQQKLYRQNKKTEC